MYDQQLAAGATITGAFKVDVDRPYHFIQAIVDHGDRGLPRWIEGGARLTAPWVDSPPGGYVLSTTQKDPHDFFPWYDNVDKDFPDDQVFPLYSDQPNDLKSLITEQKNHAGFETWLVGTVSEEIKDRKKGSANQFKVAPLFGWSWGYTLQRQTDDSVTSTLDKLEWNLKEPSKKWLDSLKTVYTFEEKKDFFNVDPSGTCKQFLAPEPSAFGLAMMLMASWLGGAWGSRCGRG